MINILWLELPLSRTDFHGPKGVRAIEVLLYHYNALNQLLQLCTARAVFSILVTVRLHTVIPEVWHSLTNEKQRKTDIRLTDQ